MMRYFDKHPMVLVAVGILGISLSSIFVKFSQAPSAVTAAWRLLWTVILMTPVVLTRGTVRREFALLDKKTVLLSLLSGVLLAVHFVLWFESLAHTSVASSTTLVCTEVIWVSFGYCLFLKGKLSGKAVLAIAVTFGGSIWIALGDSSVGEAGLYGDALAVAAAVAVAGYTLIGRVVRARVSTTVYTYLVYFACAVSLVGTCLAEGLPLLAYGMSPVWVGSVLAVCSTILGHSIFSWCLKFFSPSFVSASKLLEPVVAAAIAAPLFGELPAASQILGGGLILGGVWYYSRLELGGKEGV